MAIDDGIDCSKDPVLVQQNEKEDADINVIIERAKRGANIEVSNRVAHYGDFTEIPTDLRECLVKVKKAEAAFMTLDAQTRFRFQNDPVKLLEFLNDTKNREEAIKLGLVNAPVKDDTLDTLKSIDTTLKANSGAKKAKPKADDE